MTTDSLFANKHTALFEHGGTLCCHTSPFKTMLYWDALTAFIFLYSFENLLDPNISKWAIPPTHVDRANLWRLRSAIRVPTARACDAPHKSLWYGERLDSVRYKCFGK